jgi:hypothetical protein
MHITWWSVAHTSLAPPPPSLTALTGKLFAPTIYIQYKYRLPIRMRRFCKKMLSLQSETQRNKIRFAHAHVIFSFFSLLFAPNFLLPTEAKLVQRIFTLFRFHKFFVLLPIFSFRFKAKLNKRFFASFH